MKLASKFFTASESMFAVYGKDNERREKTMKFD